MLPKNVVKYEYYREKIGEVDSSLQQLLVPYLFEFSGSDYISLQEKMSLLNQVGIYLEPYGNNTFILREHPIWMKEEEIESAVYEMCDMLLLTNEVSVKTYRAELAIMMSCKRSIKANHALDDYSARDLLVQLAQCKNPYNCPHGRPVLVNFTKSDMEKIVSVEFKKIIPVYGDLGKVLKLFLILALRIGMLDL